MKKLLATIFLLALLLPASGKRTYIPRYTTTIGIVQAISDTLTAFSHAIEVPLASPDGLFTVTVYHDDMTLEKLKTIRRNKAAAGWAGAFAVLSAFSAAVSGNFADRLVNLYNSEAAATLSNLYSSNAESANVLGIELVIDNTSLAELQVNDLERGLTWYILPHHSLHLQLSNPDIALLRIADTGTNRPHYVNVGTGSEMKGMDVIYEDEDYVVKPSYDTYENGARYVDFYQLIDRRTFEQRSMTKEEYKQFLKERK